jgi:hypothetical protein
MLVFLFLSNLITAIGNPSLLVKFILGFQDFRDPFP